MDWHQREGLRLQNKAKQWLEAVTGQEIRAEDNLTDILADGVILKTAGRKIKRFLNTGTPIKDHEKSDEKERRLSVGAYTPYNNIDEFISVCKAVGVLDIDLFVPSDVVERSGDLRMLVLCLRALSRKCRAMDLPVPDFDTVAGFHKQSTPDGSMRGVSDFERFPSLVMPPVVDRESSLTPDKSLSLPEHEFGGIRCLQLDGDSLESSPIQRAEKPFVAEEALSQPSQSGIKSSQLEDENTSETASNLTDVLVPKVESEIVEDELQSKDEIPSGKSGIVEDLPSKDGTPASESGIVNDELQSKDEAPSSVPINSSPSNLVSSDVMGNRTSSSSSATDNGQGDVSANPGKDEVQGVVATQALGSKTEVDYPPRAVSLRRNSVDDLKGGSYIVVTNKTMPAEVPKKADESDKREGDTASKAIGTSNAYPARSISQGRKPVDELQGGSYIVVTNDRKRDPSTKGLSTTQSNISDKSAGGGSSRAPPPVSQSNAVGNRVTDAISTATTAANVDNDSGGVPSKAIHPAIRSSESERGLDDASSKPAEFLQSVVPELRASSIAVSPATPSSSLDRRSVDVSANVGSPPPAAAAKNGKVAVKGPASVIQSPRVDSKVGAISRTVWPPIQPHASDVKAEDITVRPRSSSINDRKGGDISSKPTPLVATPNNLDNMVGSLVTKATSPLAQSKSANKEEDDLPVVSSKRLWIPIVAGAFALVGTFLAFRFRGSGSREYQIKEGDTLYGISKKTGKENWGDLARINPQISNPDLIYPSNRLKLD